MCVFKIHFDVWIWPCGLGDVRPCLGHYFIKYLIWDWDCACTVCICVTLIFCDGCCKKPFVYWGNGTRGGNVVPLIRCEMFWGVTPFGGIREQAERMSCVSSMILSYNIIRDLGYWIDSVLVPLSLIWYYHPFGDTSWSSTDYKQLTYRQKEKLNVS